MDDKQQKFISWLSGKLGAQDDQDLQKKLEGLGQEGIKKAYDQFLAEEGSEVPMNELGGKLDYLKCLKELKKGGSVDCGCGGMKMKDKGGKIKKAKCPTCGKSNCSCKLKKYQHGGQLSIADKPIQKVQPTPSKPGVGVKGVGPAGYYSLINTGVPGKDVKNPLSPDAQVRQIGDKYYDYSGMEGLDYDFNTKKISAQPDWFNSLKGEQGGMKFNDINAYNDWVNGWVKGPKQVYPAQQQQAPTQELPRGGNAQYVVPSSGSSGQKSGWQGSPEQRDSVFAKEQVLRAQSQHNGTRMHQQGGQLQPKGQPTNSMMQQPTPEQVQEQKVDMKAEELSMKGNPKAKQAQANAMLTPLEQLQAAFDKERLKLKPEPTMTLVSKNGKVYGSGKEVK